MNIFVHADYSSENVDCLNLKKHLISEWELDNYDPLLSFDSDCSHGADSSKLGYLRQQTYIAIFRQIGSLKSLQASCTISEPILKTLQKNLCGFFTILVVFK